MPWGCIDCMRFVVDATAAALFVGLDTDGDRTKIYSRTSNIQMRRVYQFLHINTRPQFLDFWSCSPLFYPSFLVGLAHVNRRTPGTCVYLSRDKSNRHLLSTNDGRMICY